MYLDKSLKQYAFETILNLLAKIMKEMDDMNEEDENKDNKKEKKNPFILLIHSPH